MADEKTFTQADIDAAIAKEVGGLKEQLTQVMDEAKEAKRKLRAASEIKPEDLTAAEERADRAEAALKEAQKTVKTLTTERDGAVKALESETAAARSYAQEAEIADAIAKGNVMADLVPAFKAMIQSQAKADLVDGKYVVTIGDKPAAEYISTFLAGDTGKAFRAATPNGGGGAPGGKGSEAGKAVSGAEFAAMNAKARAAFMEAGGVIAN